MSSPTTMQRAEEFLAERRRLGFQALKSRYALISFARYTDGLDQSGPLTVEHLADCIREGKRPVISAEHARHCLHVMLASMEAARTGAAQEVSTTF